MDRSIAPGLLMLIAGVWLLLQTVAGDLPRRLLSLTARSDDPRAGTLYSDPAGGGGGFSASGGGGGGGGGSGAR